MVVFPKSNRRSTPLTWKSVKKLFSRFSRHSFAPNWSLRSLQHSEFLLVPRSCLFPEGQLYMAPASRLSFGDQLC